MTATASEGDRVWPARAYVAGWVAVATVVAATVTLVDPAGDVLRPAWWLVALLWVGLIVASVPGVMFAIGAVSRTTTFVELAAVPVMVLLSPRWAVAVGATSLLVLELLVLRRETRKAAFNVAWHVTGIALGTTAFHALAGHRFEASSVDVLAALLAAALFVAVNLVAMAGLLKVLTARRWHEIVHEEATSTLVDFGIAGIGVLVVVLAVEAPFALPLLAVPAIVDRARARAHAEGHRLAAEAEAAAAAMRAQNVFLSRASHEFRTPLTTILGFGHLLEDDDQLGDEAKDYVERILRSGRHLLDLVNELLEVSEGNRAQVLWRR